MINHFICKSRCCLSVGFNNNKSPIAMLTFNRVIILKSKTLKKQTNKKKQNTKLKQKMRLLESLIKQRSRCISQWSELLSLALSQARPWCSFPFFVFVPTKPPRDVFLKTSIPWVQIPPGNPPPLLKISHGPKTQRLSRVRNSHKNAPKQTLAFECNVRSRFSFLCISTPAAVIVYFKPSEVQMQKRALSNCIYWF